VGAAACAIILCWFSVHRIFQNFAGAPCSEAVAKEVVSPDHTHKVDLIRQTCIEENRSSVLLVLLGGNEDPAKSGGLPISNLANTTPEEVSVTWEGSDKVLISYSESGNPKGDAQGFTEELSQSGISFELRSK
jgi:hypothetical protein